jgi:hypothetical protein
VGVPKLLPLVSPRLVVQLGFLALFAGIVVMIGALDAGGGLEIVGRPIAVHQTRRGSAGITARNVA